MKCVYDINIVKYHKKYFKEHETFDNCSSDMTLKFSDGRVYSYQILLFYLVYPDPDMRALIRRRSECDGFNMINIIIPDLSVEKFEKCYIYSTDSDIISKEAEKYETIEDYIREDEIFNQRCSNTVSQLESELTTDEQILTSTFICEKCGNVYKSAALLKKHSYQKHSLKTPIKCNSCEKAFVHQYELNKHMFKHMSENLFACEMCGVSFKRRDALSKHKAICPKLERVVLKCRLCDDKKFTSEKTLNLHLNTVHGSLQFPCHHCGKMFSRKDGLKRHLKVHSSS